VHFNVTDSPTAAWTAQQLDEAFPNDSAPRCLLRDRDGIYGDEFRRRVKGMLIAEVRRRLHSYLRYYHGSRTHLALEKSSRTGRRRGTRAGTRRCPALVL
jgi:hypothetical protein